MSPCPMGMVQWIQMPGVGHLLESNLAMLTGFKAQQLYITASITRNNREGCLVRVVMKPGGTAHTFCTAYFQIGFGPALLLC